MAHFFKIALVLAFLLPMSGCRTIGQMFEGQNSDLQQGGGYCPVPERDADGELHVPYRDWSEGPARVW